MVKKRVKKVKRAHKSSTKKQIQGTGIERQLIDNFISLQRVLTNLSIKFDTLSDNISKLLQLFEISAKSFVEKLPETAVVDAAGKEKDKDFLNKIDTLLEQNKTIAKGLTLMEEKLRGRVYGQELRAEAGEGRPRYPNM